MKGSEGAFPGRVVFDHLVKAGGQAVNAWLRSVLGTACVTKNLSGNHRELIQRYGGEYSVISSHVAFYGEGLDPRYSYLTCLREPVDRVLSQLFFTVNNHTEDKVPDLWRKVERLLAAHGVCSGETEGAQGKEVERFSLQDIPLTCNYYVSHFCSVVDEAPKSDEAKLRGALSAIAEYDLWGIYEQLPEFTEDFAALLQIPAPPRIARINQTTSRLAVSEVPPSLRREIESMNALDLEFYHQLRAEYAAARKRWRRPSVTTARWLPFEPMTNPIAVEPEFTLISAVRKSRSELTSQDILVFQLEFSLDRDLGALEIGIHVCDDVGGYVFGTNSTLVGTPPEKGHRGTHRVCLSMPATLPTGSYTAGFTISELCETATRVVAVYERLIPFQVVLPPGSKSAGRVEMAVELDHRHISADVVKLADDTAGRMVLVGGSTALQPDMRAELRVRIHNESGQDWQSTQAHPLSLSYHWRRLDGSLLLFEGERSEFPNGRLIRGASLEAAMEILAPVNPGKYVLVAMPVQEGYCWFDEKGFTALELDSEILAGEYDV